MYLLFHGGGWVFGKSRPFISHTSRASRVARFVKCSTYGGGGSTEGARVREYVFCSFLFFSFLQVVKTI